MDSSLTDLPPEFLNWRSFQRASALDDDGFPSLRLPSAAAPQDLLLYSFADLYSRHGGTFFGLVGTGSSLLLIMRSKFMKEAETKAF